MLGPRHTLILTLELGILIIGISWLYIHWSRSKSSSLSWLLGHVDDHQRQAQNHAI